jgi:hypothetical protein
VDVPVKVFLQIKAKQLTKLIFVNVILCQNGQAFVPSTFKFWECIDCTSGKFVDPMEMKSCIDCPAGFFSETRSTACLECKAGRASPIQSQSCIECVSGKYSNEFQMSECLSCPKNSYANQNGATNCTQCPANGLTLYSGSSNILQCICLSGYFGVPYQGEACKACPSQIGVSCPDESVIPFVEAGHWRTPGLPDAILDCIPSSACPLTGFSNITTCEEGYTGYICGDCQPLQYFRLDDKCRKCNSAPIFMWILLIVVVIFFVYFGFRVTQSSNRIPFVMILSFFFCCN